MKAVIAGCFGVVWAGTAFMFGVCLVQAIWDHTAPLIAGFLTMFVFSTATAYVLFSCASSLKNP